MVKVDAQERMQESIAADDTAGMDVQRRNLSDEYADALLAFISFVTGLTFSVNHIII